MASALGGCAAPPRVHTTFLTGVDMVHITDRMAESFAADEVIGERTSDSEPWVISIYRVVNHTNQIMPERERWLYVGRLRALLAQSDLSERRRITWVIPPERWPLIREATGADEPPELRTPPTHLLTAEFRTLTRTGPHGRSDAYVCSFQLVDLERGTIVWEDLWEVKRAAAGLTFD